MEQQNQEQLFDIQIDESARETIKGISTWAMVVVITAVVGYLIELIKAFTAKPDVVQFEGFETTTSPSQGIAGAIITVAIGLLINYFLYRFAVQAKNGVDNLNQAELTGGFSNLKIYFMIIGILVIILLIFFVLGALVVGTMTE
jgi:hypothetical protein